MSDETKMLVIYRKIDGKIVRVGTLPPSLEKNVSEDDIDKFWPGIDKAQYAMVFVEGKQYLEIDKYCVDTDIEGNFIGIVEKTEVLSRTDSIQDTELYEDLLERDASVVIAVLSVIDDEERLRKYKILEEQGRNRIEVMNFFKQRGIV